MTPEPKRIALRATKDDIRRINYLRKKLASNTAGVLRMALKSLYEQQRASRKNTLTVVQQPEVSTQ